LSDQQNQKVQAEELEDDSVSDEEVK